MPHQDFADAGIGTAVEARRAAEEGAAKKVDGEKGSGLFYHGREKKSPDPIGLTPLASCTPEIPYETARQILLHQ